METTVEPQAQRRLTLVAWFGVIWGVVLIARLIQLHVLEHDQLRLVAKSQQEHTVEVAAARGTILSGGEGGGPLALSVPVRRVAINPLRIAEGGEGFVTTVLQGLLGLDGDALLKDIQQARIDRNGYLVIKEDASNEEINRLARSYMNDPVEVNVSRDEMTVEEVAQAWIIQKRRCGNLHA